MEIDSLDKQLIDLLMTNARQNSDVLGKQLNLSSSTVRRRMKNLIDQGVINIVAVPESNKIGMFLEAIIALDVYHEKMDSVLKQLKKHPQVRWVAITSGRFDMLAHTWYESTEELFGFIENELGKIKGISKSETFICLHVEKNL